MSESDKEKDGYKRKGYGKIIYQSSFSRRNWKHDYTKPATYHVIFEKDSSCPYFGVVAGSPEIVPGMPGCAEIDRSPIGKIIQKEIYYWPLHYNFLKIYKYCVMPDHVHIVVRVIREIPHKFGFYVGKLKARIKRGCEEKLNYTGEIFVEDFTDKIIYPNRSLDGVIQYVKHNPHRLAMRKMRPDFFTTLKNITIAGEKWQAYGNLFLLRNPMKEAVIVHHRYSPAEKAEYKDFWLQEAKEGTVLVSAFFSPDEKVVRDEAEKFKGKMIHIQQNPFPEKFKPEKRRFEQCSEGNLLILAPMEPLQEPHQRAICLHLNRIAEALCAMSY